VNVRNRIVLIATAVLATLILSVAFVVEERLESTARSRAAAELQAASETARQLEIEQRERLSLQADLLTQLLPVSTNLISGNSRALGELVADFAARPRTADVVLVLDPSGEPLAASGGSARFAHALADSSTAAEQTLAAVDGRLYGVLVRPIAAAATGARLGSVVVAEEVGATAAERLARLTHSEVVLLFGGSPMISTLPLGTAGEVTRALPELTDGEPEVVQIRGQDYLARLESFSPDGTGRILLSAYAEHAPPSSLGRRVLLVGLVAMAVILPLLWLGGNRLQRALRNLSEAMAATAVSGRLEHDLHTPLIDRWSAPEVTGLAESFHSLMRTVEESLRDRERSYVEAVGAVVAAIDARDHETTGHSFRVAHYALALARALGIEGEDLRAIEWGSLLHDVGKIAVPDAILRKAGRLTDEEWHIMRQHPNWGFEMLADVQFLEPALEIVYSHHERWDGGGYPRGLKREEIPLAARIFAAVDTYDSITSDRPYRRARSHAEAVTELCRVAGTQLDPDVVEAFIRIPEVKLRRLRERSERVDLSVRIPDAIVELPATSATLHG
jgi:putative nucleotidyltransferase with HDIG domain